jgi:rhodanese-related sulfurtransferase
MKKLIVLLLALLTAAALVVSCSGNAVNQSSGGYTNISPTQLNAMMANKDFLLVNVHIPYYAEIAETDLFIPYNKIPENISLLPDKQAKIVVYCQSGPMSTTAAGLLSGMGYTNIFNLSGGMDAWKAAGYTLLQKAH